MRTLRGWRSTAGAVGCSSELRARPTTRCARWPNACWRSAAQRGATLIVDDRVDLAKAIGADGVHLGREDMPVAEARERLGEAFLIGGTANTFEDVERLCRAGVDYIGCGPFRFTTTKERLAPVLGLSGYASLMARMADAGLHTPVVAIGGVTCADVPALMATGVRGVAVSGAILRAADPVSEMDAFLHADE